MTDYKQLCAELISALDTADTALLGTDRAQGAKVVRDALQCARAALAEPEPEGPTDEELLAMFDKFDIDGMAEETKGMPLDTFWADYQPREAVKFARAVLARWGK